MRRRYLKIIFMDNVPKGGGFTRVPPNTAFGTREECTLWDARGDGFSVASRREVGLPGYRHRQPSGRIHAESGGDCFDKDRLAPEKTRGRQ